MLGMFEEAKAIHIQEHSLADFMETMVYNHNKITNLISMGSLGTQSLKQVNKSNDLNLKTL